MVDILYSSRFFSASGEDAAEKRKLKTSKSRQLKRTCSLDTPPLFLPPPPPLPLPPPPPTFLPSSPSPSPFSSSTSSPSSSPSSFPSSSLFTSFSSLFFPLLLLPPPPRPPTPPPPLPPPPPSSFSLSADSSSPLFPIFIVSQATYPCCYLIRVVSLLQETRLARMSRDGTRRCRKRPKTNCSWNTIHRNTDVHIRSRTVRLP